MGTPQTLHEGDLVASSAQDKAVNRWGTTTPVGYSPDANYTQASDKQGHSAKLTVKLPVNVAGEVAAAVQSGKISDYKTAQDFIRDAVIHRLHYHAPTLDDQDIERKISMWTIHNDAMRAKQQREEYAEMMGSIEEHITHLSTTGQRKTLRDYLVDLLDKTELAIPEQFQVEYREFVRARLKIVGQ